MSTSVEWFKEEWLSSDQEALRTFYNPLLYSTPLPYYLNVFYVFYDFYHKPRDILEFIIANVLERFGFRVETNKMAKTKDGRVIEVDVWGVKTIGSTRFYVYASCKNWDKKVDRDVIFSEIGRISNLIQHPHLKIFVCKELTDPARETALTDGFTVIELREKANSENADEIAEIIYNRLNELFTGIAPPELQRIAKEAKAISEKLKSLVDELDKLTKLIDSKIEKSTVEVAKPEVEEVKPEKPEKPEKRIINLESEEDILDVLDKEWSCIVTKGVYNCLKEKYILPPVTMRRLVEVFAKVAKLVLHDREPKYVREWFITGYCPMYDDVIKMLFMFGLDSETFKNWFRNVYNRYKPSLEAKAKMKLPDYEIFYNDFKEFIINYKLLQ